MLVRYFTVRLLGPIEVVDPHGLVQLGGSKERTTLAVLALAPGRTVTGQQLIDALWDDQPPRTATKTLQTYIARLHRTLGNTVVSVPGGYVLDVETDVAMVEELAREARALSKADPAAAALRFAEALGRWRGRPLAEAARTPWVAAQVARLDELRNTLAEEWVNVELACGRHVAILADLEAMVTEAPLRERRWAQLIVALYRSGRQAEALRAYARLRSTLVEELGIEPSPELRALEHRVLAQDRSLDLHLHKGGVVVHTPANPASPSGVVTFLLTDVEGSTALWERSAPAMDRALARHDAIVAGAVGAHGGTLLKQRGEGDSTFSVFARASDAVAAALRCQHAFAVEEWPTGAELKVRCALATGEAVERDGDYYGTAVNRAARLRSLARGGDVLLAQSTAGVVVDNLPDGARLLDVGSRTLKDLARPEHLWRLVTDADVGAEQQLDHRDLNVPLPPCLAVVAARPFLGRKLERDRLDRVREADGRHLVWVRGEPGIGKTRLVAEWARDVHRQGSVVLYGRCDDELCAPYQPFLEALRHLATAVPPGVLEAATGCGLVHLARLLPEVSCAGSAPAGDADEYGLFDAIDRLVTGIAAVAPLVVILDDLHWADRSSLLLLRHLARSGRTARLLIVASYRDTGIDTCHPLGNTLADLRRDGDDERIDVGPLTAFEVDALVTQLGITLEPASLETLIAETDGNPFYVTQVARHLAETGSTTSSVPEGVREVVNRRLSRLSADANQALTVAAVVGRDFSAMIIEAAGGPRGEALEAALDEAVRTRVLEEVPEWPGRYRFSQALIRQTLVDELSANRRALLHGRVSLARETRDLIDAGTIAGCVADGILVGDLRKAAEA